ncbi:hypothetical protein [Paraglaciecola sp. MB-3u-78]|uniref:hypothetical protein n=1 Tax=Paraglaciecola sp. MB-3u-78 TaxID=2058332 RepID=UPI000C342275|nr:hypothetical protein [Paraglaciecola sp. MB-3u-78]PKG99377.1 hypothetical protein CXF95_09005 [Paraglaciecola sp. MB-3u-78]
MFRSIICTVLLSTFASTAGAVIIDFESALTFPYTEDGFLFQQTAGSSFSFSANGNPSTSFDGGSVIPNIGDTVTVTQIGGGLFTFDSFDAASFVDNFSTTRFDFFGIVAGHRQNYSQIFLLTIQPGRISPHFSQRPSTRFLSLLTNRDPRHWPWTISV